MRALGVWHPLRALATGLHRQDHVWITTNHLAFPHKDEFDEMLCKLNSTEYVRSFKLNPTLAFKEIFEVESPVSAKYVSQDLHVVCLARFTQDFVRYMRSLGRDLHELPFRITFQDCSWSLCREFRLSRQVEDLGGGAGIQVAHAASHMWAHAGIPTVPWRSGACRGTVSWFFCG